MLAAKLPLTLSSVIDMTRMPASIAVVSCARSVVDTSLGDFVRLRGAHYRNKVVVFTQDVSVVLGCLGRVESASGTQRYIVY